MKSRLVAFALALAITTTFLTPSVSAASTLKGTKSLSLTIFAASSLAQSFTTMGKSFETKHPGVTIRFSFLASSTLAAQLNAGAPADIFASASEADMALAKSRIRNSFLFAANRIVLATPRGNAFHINKIVDLNREGVKWVQCAHPVPCGMAADSALASDGRVKSKPVSLEPKVANAVAKLIAGEVDAAFIYHTDYVANARKLKEIRFRNQEAATTRYFIGLVTESKQSTLAQSFLETLFSAAGRKVLAEAGFIRVSTVLK